MNFDDTANKASQLMPNTSDDQQGNDPQSQQHDQLESGNEPSEHSQPEEFDISGQLPTIHEDDAENDLTVETFYDELVSERHLEEDPTFAEVPMQPVHMTPENTVSFMTSTV